MNSSIVVIWTVRAVREKKWICGILSNFWGWFFQIFVGKIFFCPQKVEKTTLKSCSEFLKSTFFPLLPAQPKWPKQKKSCSKMWPIDQLYIELGQKPQKSSYFILLQRWWGAKKRDWYRDVAITFEKKMMGQWGETCLEFNEYIRYTML